MDTIIEIVRLSAFVIFGLILPQALGYVSFRWTRRRGLLLSSVSMLVPPLVFFISSDLFWTLSAKSIRDAGLRVCGAFGAAASFATVFGTLIHLCIAGLAFLVLSLLWKRKIRRLQAGGLAS
jgi:hypothetical protein